VANMASIIADIGDRSAPAAEADRRGPSRICIRISRSVPALPRIPRTTFTRSAGARHGRRLREPSRNRRRGDGLASGSRGAGVVALAEERSRPGDAGALPDGFLVWQRFGFWTTL
jgi:hypothetical protein